MGPVYGIGNPLLDTLVYGEQGFLDEIQVRPGTMNLVNAETQLQVIASGRIADAQPGGSTANAMRVYAWLSNARHAPPVYTGAIGEDRRGSEFESLLERAGVTCRLARVTAPTGGSVIYITPDKERTMFTALGACLELEPHHIDHDALRTCSRVHVTGYVWDAPSGQDAAMTAIRAARDRGIPVSFDVSDVLVAERHRSDFFNVLSGSIETLFANESELASLAETEDLDRMIEQCRGLAEYLVIKRGALGCRVVDSRSVTDVEGLPVAVVDTSGAGDTVAGAYLFAREEGYSPVQAARFGNYVASRVVQAIGCDTRIFDRETISGFMSSL
ncbi:MAG: adenosine kinase [Spirochaetaceae bacterium]